MAKLTATQLNVKKSKKDLEQRRAVAHIRLSSHGLLTFPPHVLSHSLSHVLSNGTRFLAVRPAPVKSRRVTIYGMWISFLYTTVHRETNCRKPTVENQL